MATFMKVSRVLFKFSRLKQLPILNKCRTRGINGAVLIAGLFAKPKLDQNTSNELPKLEESDPSKLSREYLIKAASIKTAEEVGTLVLQSALALIQAEKEYSEAVYALVVLMEYKLKVLDNKTEEERIWDLVLAGRDLVNRKLTQKRTLEMIFINSKNMLSTAAEVAYMTGADFVGNIAGDKMYKIEQHIKQVQKETEEIEVNLRKVETKTVEIEAEHANETSDTEDDFTTVEDEPNDSNEPTIGSKDSHNLSDIVKTVEVKTSVQEMSSVRNKFEDGVDTSKIIQDFNDFEKYGKEESIEDISDKTVKQKETVEDDITDRTDSAERQNEDLKF